MNFHTHFLLNLFLANIGQNRKRLSALVGSAPPSLDLIFFQEPRPIQHGIIADGLTPEGQGLFGFPKFPGCTAFHHPVTSLTNYPRAVTYICNTRLPIHFHLRPDIVAYQDVAVVSCTVGEAMVFLVNIYNKSGRRAAINKVMHANLDWNWSTVLISGDFNLHHDMWCLCTDIRTMTSPAAEDVASWVDTFGLSILNNQDTPIRPISNSIIDLTITNDPSSILAFSVASSLSDSLHSDNFASHHAASSCVEASLPLPP
jgi:hypothetical protein